MYCHSRVCSQHASGFSSTSSCSMPCMPWRVCINPESPTQPGATLSADRPEGNGTGIVWDDAGHIVTNYHVLGGALRNYRPGQGQQAPKVARVTLLGGQATHNSICARRTAHLRASCHNATAGQGSIFTCFACGTAWRQRRRVPPLHRLCLHCATRQGAAL